MAETPMTRDALIAAFADAFERFIVVATDAAQKGVTRDSDIWGPRETAAHLAGWEVMATVRIPHNVAGMPMLEFPDPAQNEVMNDAINATIVAMIGDQSLDAICAILRRAYQQDITMLHGLDAQFFQLGQYVYERTKDVIEHCQEHAEMLTQRAAS